MFHPRLTISNEPRLIVLAIGEEKDSFHNPLCDNVALKLVTGILDEYGVQVGETKPGYESSFPE